MDLTTPLLELAQAIDAERDQYDDLTDLFKRNNRAEKKLSPSDEADLNQMIADAWHLSRQRADEIQRLGDDAPDHVRASLYHAATRLRNGDRDVPKMLEEAAAAIKGAPALRIGDQRYQAGNGAPIILEESEDHVLKSLIELGGAASKSQLVDQSGKDDGPRILKSIRAKHPELAPHIYLPRARGKGGYRTTIQRADQPRH